MYRINCLKMHLSKEKCGKYQEFNLKFILRVYFVFVLIFCYKKSYGLMVYYSRVGLHYSTDFVLYLKFNSIVLTQRDYISYDLFISSDQQPIKMQIISYMHTSPLEKNQKIRLGIWCFYFIGPFPKVISLNSLL